MTRIAAVILAGGKGERLGGVNKALLTIGDDRFIDRAMAVTGGCSPRLLAVGRAPFEAPGDLTQILDLESDYGGPCGVWEDGQVVMVEPAEKAEALHE